MDHRTIKWRSIVTSPSKKHRGLRMCAGSRRVSTLHTRVSAPRSEYETQAELYVSFCSTESRGYLPKLRAGNIGDRVLQGRVIKDVVELGPELEVVLLQKTS